jgi:hypothetical protein
LSSAVCLSFFRTPHGRFCFCSAASHLQHTKHLRYTVCGVPAGVCVCVCLPVLSAVRVHQTHPAVRVTFIHRIHLEWQSPPLQTFIYRERGIERQL